MSSFWDRCFRFVQTRWSSRSKFRVVQTEELPDKVKKYTLYGSKIRRHWSVAGLIRFNGVGGFDPHFPARSVGATFECADLVFSRGGNRVFFLRKAAHSAWPDCFLVVMCSDRFGMFDCQTNRWKSASVVPIAISESSDRQEAMLLMKPLGWVQTALGMWQLKTNPALRYGAALELLENPVVG